MMAESSTSLPSIFTSQSDWALNKYKQIANNKKSYDDRPNWNKQTHKHDDITDIDMDLGHDRKAGLFGKDSQTIKKNANRVRSSLDDAIRHNILRDQQSTPTIHTSRSNTSSSQSHHLKVSNLSSNIYTSRTPTRPLSSLHPTTGGIKTGSKLVAIGERHKNKPNFMQPIKQARRYYAQLSWTVILLVVLVLHVDDVQVTAIFCLLNSLLCV